MILMLRLMGSEDLMFDVGSYPIMNQGSWAE